MLQGCHATKYNALTYSTRPGESRVGRVVLRHVTRQEYVWMGQLLIDRGIRDDLDRIGK